MRPSLISLQCNCRFHSSNYMNDSPIPKKTACIYGVFRVVIQICISVTSQLCRLKKVFCRSWSLVKLGKQVYFSITKHFQVACYLFSHNKNPSFGQVFFFCPERLQAIKNIKDEDRPLLQDPNDVLEAHQEVGC